MRNLIGHILRFVLPCLFFAYMGCISLFRHSHIVNGVTIVHSHPFAQEEHEHSSSELELIQHFNTVWIDDTLFPAATGFAPLQFLCRIVSETPASNPLQIEESLFFLRGPPRL